MDSYYNEFGDTVTTQARQTTDMISGTIGAAADNPVGRMAQGVSESNEINDAQEPMNSTMRTLLLGGAGLSVAGSLVLAVMGKKHESLFVGQWAPTLLTIALWYQIVKGQQGQTSTMR